MPYYGAFTFTPAEEKEAREAEKRTQGSGHQGVQHLAKHPKGEFASLLGQCSRCHIHVTVGLRKNGVPGGLIFDFYDGKWVRLSYDRWKHLGCGGHLQKFRECIPPGYGIYESLAWKRRE